MDEIQADFHGDNAKLEWVVSLDGKEDAVGNVQDTRDPRKAQERAKVISDGREPMEQLVNVRSFPGYHSPGFRRS